MFLLQGTDPGPSGTDKFQDETPDEGIRLLMEAGSTRNLLRAAKADGLRLIAFIARFCEPGEDPVKFLARVLLDQGYDIGG